jgi:hypothetical protein
MRSLFVIIIGVIVYVVFSIIATPFLGYNFGAKPTFFERFVKFFIEYPFGLLKVLSENYFILMLVLNGVFWSFLILKGIPIIKKLILK